jgi:hypothetical protein
MSGRSPFIATSLVGAFVLALLAAACASPGSIESRARAHVAARLKVPSSSLRVTNQSELSTEHHAVVRVMTSDGTALVVALARRGDLVVDGTMSDAFVRLAAAEHLGTRFSVLGADRVAGWYGALGGGPCGEVLPSRGPSQSVQTTRSSDVIVLVYPFASGRRVEQCRVELDLSGQVRSAAAEALPLATR